MSCYSKKNDKKSGRKRPRKGDITFVAAPDATYTTLNGSGSLCNDIESTVGNEADTGPGVVAPDVDTELPELEQPKAASTPLRPSLK